MNDDITNAGHAFIGSAVADIGQYSFVQLWNPADSGVDLWVDKIVAANSSTTPSAADLRPMTMAMGTVHLHGFNRLVGEPASKAEIRAGNIAALPVVNGRMAEMWLSGPLTERVYDFDPAIKVRPGNGLFVAQWVPNEHTIASWHWRETENLDPPAATLIGNMTVNGGLAAAFDGNPTKPYAQAAVSSLNPSGGAFAGKGFGAAPQAVASARVYPTTDEGFDGNDGVMNFEIYGNHSAPASPNDGTLLGSLTSQADTTTGFKEIASSDQATAWEFIWLRLYSTSGGNHTYCLGQVHLFAP